MLIESNYDIVTVWNFFCYLPYPPYCICLHVYCLTLLQIEWLAFFPLLLCHIWDSNVSLVASLWGTLTQDTLPTELPQPRQTVWKLDDFFSPEVFATLMSIAPSSSSPSKMASLRFQVLLSVFFYFVQLLLASSYIKFSLCSLCCSFSPIKVK